MFQIPMHPFRPCLADDPAPQRIVEIGDQPFFGRRRRDQVRQRLAESRSVRPFIRESGKQVRLKVVTLCGRGNQIEMLRAGDGNRGVRGKLAGGLLRQCVQARLGAARLPRSGVKNRRQRQARKRGRHWNRISNFFDHTAQRSESGFDLPDNIVLLRRTPPAQIAVTQARIQIGPLQRDRHRARILRGAFAQRAREIAI